MTDNCPAKPSGTLKYTDCISVDRKSPTPKEYPRYDNKQFDHEAPALKLVQCEI